MAVGLPALSGKLRQLADTQPRPVAEFLRWQADHLDGAWREFKMTLRRSDAHADWLTFKLICARFSARAAYEVTFRATAR